MFGIFTRKITIIIEMVISGWFLCAPLLLYPHVYGGTLCTVTCTFPDKRKNINNYMTAEMCWLWFCKLLLRSCVGLWYALYDWSLSECRLLMGANETQRESRVREGFFTFPWQTRLIANSSLNALRRFWELDALESLDCSSLAKSNSSWIPCGVA